MKEKYNYVGIKNDNRPMAESFAQWEYKYFKPEFYNAYKDFYESDNGKEAALSVYPELKPFFDDENIPKSCKGLMSFIIDDIGYHCGQYPPFNKDLLTYGKE